MLNRIADNYDEDVDNAVAGITSIIEPVMIVFLAVVVGFIVIALFLPIVEIIKQLTGWFDRQLIYKTRDHCVAGFLLHYANAYWVRFALPITVKTVFSIPLMNTILTAFIALLILKYVTSTILDVLNMRHVNSKSAEVPETFRDFIDLPTYQKSVAYTV